MPSPTQNTTLAPYKKLLCAGIILLVAVLVGELAAKAVIIWGLGISRWSYDTYYAQDEKLNRLTWSLKFSPHPYFGYENAAIRRFEAERDHRSKGDYVIGVLGGSVAESFAAYAGKHLEHFEPLRAALPKLDDKRLVIANLALGGGHQPQQYFIAAFFLDDVDLFISIEGFNETQMPNFFPAYPLEFPSVMRFYERRSRARVYRWLAWPLTAAYRAMSWPPLRLRGVSRSNLYFLFWHLAAPRLYGSVHYLERLYHDAIRYGGAAQGGLSGKDLLERQVQTWRRYARLQDALINRTAQKQGFIFLQPNQHLKGSKQFSEFERTAAVNPDLDARVHGDMQRLKEEFRALNEQGVRAYDLTEIFRDTADTVYIDRCCHLNDLGNEIMAQAIVSRIISSDRGTLRHRESFPGRIQ